MTFTFKQKMSPWLNFANSEINLLKVETTGWDINGNI